MHIAMNSDAKLSTCGRYRYLLNRTWDDTLEALGIVCLNPSTADADKDDNTVRKCLALTEHWGYGGFVLVNLFAWRDTDKREIKEVDDPIGPRNDSEIENALADVDDVLVAWGDGGVYLGRSLAVRRILTHLAKNYFCIKQNASGEPVHPLYQSNTSEHQCINLNY